MAGKSRTRSPSVRRRPAAPAVEVGAGFATHIAVFALLAAVVALAVFVRVRIAGVPLERDEGEYAYAGQLILQGIPPYEQVYNMKFPGTYYAYAAIMAVLGQTVWGIRIGLLCVHLATAACVFGLGRRLFGAFAAAIGTSAFILLALDRWTMGTFAHATQFVALPATAGLLVLHLAMRKGGAWKFVAAGALMGLAITMKQHAAGFAVIAAGLAWWSGRAAALDAGGREPWRRAGLVGAGVMLTLAALVGVLALEGVLGRFWFWTVQYAAAYVSQVPLSDAGAMLALAWTYITQANSWLWYAAIGGVLLLFAGRWAGEGRLFATGWILAAALSIVPGFFFRPHYFLVLLPVAGLLVGVAAATVDRALARPLGAAAARVATVVLVAALAGHYVQRERAYLFTMDDTELVRSLYDTNPFLESPEIARYLAAHTGPGDRIVVFGSEPQIFFYANRTSATGYIYMYPLMENQPFASQMQDEMRREVEAARPAYLVFVAVPLSWGARAGSDQRLFTWANEFTAKCYERVGVATIPRGGAATIRWDEASVGETSGSQSQVLTFRRRAAPGCS